MYETVDLIKKLNLTEFMIDKLKTNVWQHIS